MTVNLLLGLFDGLHRGHMSAVSELLKADGKKLVFTFNSEGFSPKGERGLLMTDRKKREALIKAGADGVISRDFSELCGLTPKEFVDSIIDKEIHAERVFCGENFRFGRDASAGAKELGALCREKGIEVSVVPLLYDGGEPISTTRIRGLIERGETLEAGRLLGYAYGFEGEILHGSQIGRRMGIRTLNIAYDRRLVLPKKGVYMSRTEIDGKSFWGITNVGDRPTVHSDGETVIETHLIDFDGEVYGDCARVGLGKFLREERRFGSLDELRETVERDIKTVKELINHE